MGIKKNFLILFFLISVISSYSVAGESYGIVSGKVLATDGTPVDYATVHLSGTTYSGHTNENGIYHIKAPAGEYSIVFSSVGYEQLRMSVEVCVGKRTKMTVKLKPTTALSEVVVVWKPVSKVGNSAFNATAVSTKDLLNTTKTLSEALSKAPGMKIRENGGVGSDMSVTMDGFSGKHVKVFIDGVLQEGVGGSFGLNNIPVNFADRIEVYRGVVPVAFGTDAIGGVINIVTPKHRRRWFVDASYSYGSFNTHKS
ncbi:MAG: TonB-dependent receptor plug domain-containing protein, partial [Duncaniella sp.]|nr:TonB-dependent receptor plug domain-containing protein [Duncaniella sp.]